MKTITHDKTFLSHLRACLAAPLLSPLAPTIKNRLVTHE